MHPPPLRPAADPVATMRTVLDDLTRVKLAIDSDPILFRDRARLLADADGAHGMLNAIGADLNDSLAAEMEHNEVEVPGVGWLSRAPKVSKRWKDDTSRERMLDDMARAIGDEVAMNPETGEVIRPIRRAAMLAVSMMLEAISVSDPKKAFRTRLGLEPADYKVEEESGYTVKVVTPLSQDGPR